MKTNKKFTKQDMTNIGQAYYKKLEEYSKLTLEQLQELLPTLGGTYRYVCEGMIRQKQTELRIESMKQNEEFVENTIEEAQVIQETIVEQSNTEINE